MILLSILYGIAAILLFRRFTPEPALRRTVNRILAHVMELGLFIDSPTLVFRAQRDLLRENLHLLRLTILPAAFLAGIFALAYSPIDAIYGHAPLPIGESSVITIQLNDVSMPSVELQTPEGIAVETPAVRILHEHQISWRIRPLRPATADLKFRLDNRMVTPSFFLHDPSIRSITILYPEVPWLGRFAVISSVSALIFGLSWKR